MPTESGPHVEVSSVSPFPPSLEDRRNASLHISGGNFNNVEGNSYNFFADCHVYLPDQRYTSGMQPVASGSARGSVTVKRLGNGLSVLNEPIGAFPPREPLDTSPQQSLEERPLSAQFVIAKSNLRSIKQLVIPHADQEGIFKRIAPFLTDLETIISFASDAYCACHGTPAMGKVIRASIEDRMTRCNTTLEELHDELGRLPYRPFPHRMQSYAYRVVYEWWTGNEPEEIAVIKIRISDEAIAIGQWLRCLHSFSWASSQLLLAKSNFTMDALERFLRSGPLTMLQTITVEEIFFLEPLQGARRSIPVRFVKTFEDVHMAVELACRGTAASRFIDSRQYQLDDPTTDIAVGSGDILQHMGKCKEYEITIVLSKLEVSPNQCPRCGLLNYDNEPTLTGWLKCHHCETKFNGRLPAVVPAEDVFGQETHPKQNRFSSRGVGLQPDVRVEEGAMDQRQDVSKHSLREEGFEQDSSGRSSAVHGLASTDIRTTAKLFRRIRFEIEYKKGMVASVTQEKTLPTARDVHHKQAGSLENVVKPIDLLREELLLWGRPSTLNSLAHCLSIDFEITRRAESLDEAIFLYKQALFMLPPGHPDRALCLGNLANSLSSQYSMTGTPESLDEAIVLYREALSLWPAGHSNHTSSLKSLAYSLSICFNFTGRADSLNEAIVLYRVALSRMPPSHPDRALCHDNLANCRSSYSRLTGAAAKLH